VEERGRAAVINLALRAASELVAAGETSSAQLLAAIASVMAAEAGVRLDYLAVVNPETLEAIEDVRDGGLLAVAAFVGSTRLIDNVLV
jgi:pantothenate synthetase